MPPSAILFIMKPLRIGLIGYDGVRGLDLIGPADAFGIPEIQADDGKRYPGYVINFLGYKLAALGLLILLAPVNRAVSLLGAWFRLK
jgi:hypothetical protein